MSEDREPIDTSTPWHRPRKEPLSLTEAQVEYERKAFRAMTEPGNGRIHPGSITTPTYEPNRAMAPDPKSIIAKKGWRPPESNDVNISKFDKVVVYSVVGCLIGIAIVVGYILTKLG